MKNTKEENKPNHLALYRKYRPDNFKDVIGQELALETLQNSIKQDKIYHAYIFSGDRGTGKTTVARIFAKEIGSTKDDIYELDAASNNSVDDIRLLTEAAQSSTFGSRYKVYILDEAHMLSKSAFNALLKTLEEPPAHVIFILATTDKHKLPNTIVSRCQEINFASPEIKTLEKLIEKVSKKEDRTLDKESINLIARQGKGSFRDTLGILEKVFSTIKENNINKEQVENIFGIVNEKEIFTILESVCEKDINKLLTHFENLNLETSQSIEAAYVETVKMMEHALFLRLIKEEEIKKIFDKKIGEDMIKKLRELSLKFGNIVSSSNLYKLLQIEKDLNTNNVEIKKTILIAGLIRIIEE
ncbi:MAG: DNA polymerase III subunit gamma/tau [Candidatus Paceibacterota bacterium]|jgi:DNA polymerase-3 subunit gamma/tau